MDEAAYIVHDCGAEVLVAGATSMATADALPRPDLPKVRQWFTTGGVAEPPAEWEPLDAAADTVGHGSIDDECEGDCLLYSSGTSGRPKGIKRPLTMAPLGDGPDGAGLFLDRVGVEAS